MRDNIIMSPSLLSALQMKTSAFACSLILVAQVITLIYISGVFLLLPLQSNQYAFGTLSGPNEKIAFYSERDGNQEIYIMNNTGGVLQTFRLTHNNVTDSGASWSPDGTKIAFASNKDGNSEIYVMNAADGSEQTRLTNNNASDAEPDW